MRACKDRQSAGKTARVLPNAVRASEVNERIVQDMKVLVQDVRVLAQAVIVLLGRGGRECPYGVRQSVEAVETVLRIRIGSGAYLTLGSGIRDG